MQGWGVLGKGMGKIVQRALKTPRIYFCLQHALRQVGNCSLPGPCQ